jgi:thiol:disulfide interchange protein DsbC
MRAFSVFTRVATAMLLALAGAPALADEEAIRRTIEAKLQPEASIESLKRSPLAGLYEVAIRSPQGLLLYYIDDAATIIIAGEMFDAKTGANLTDERLRSLSAFGWDRLPFEHAISTVRGTGRRKIAVFSDPNCPYCKRFENDLAKLDDITIHIFLYPIIKRESVNLTKSVWCSEDRARAWNDLMLRGVQPSASPECDTPVEKLVALGRRLGANSTPTWFLENGELHQGAKPLEDVRRLLDAASPQ